MSMDTNLQLASVETEVYNTGSWIGRAWFNADNNFTGKAGPLPVFVKNGKVYVEPTAPLIVAEILEGETASLFTGLKEENIKCSAEEILENSIFYKKDNSKPFLLAPSDLQAVKACGVTFAGSLIERIIEEKAEGDPLKSHEIREEINELIGADLSQITPGSDEAMALKAKFQEMGLWSQYLEVGIGPYAEVFSKSQILSSITYGAEAGLFKDSSWNNPEPEVVLAVNSKGNIVGATLGNDVNLRDIEGKSALLLGKAKDENGSCVIGPFIRLFDETYSLEDLKKCTVSLTMEGPDGFYEKAESHMSMISRSPESLVSQVINESHQYPDGFVLFLGTMFAPGTDRNEPDMGFTHHYGDRVEISTEKLGTLVNWMNRCDKIEPWTYGLGEFIKYLSK